MGEPGGVPVPALKPLGAPAALAPGPNRASRTALRFASSELRDAASSSRRQARSASSAIACLASRTASARECARSAVARSHSDWSESLFCSSSRRSWSAFSVTRRWATRRSSICCSKAHCCVPSRCPSLSRRTRDLFSSAAMSNSALSSDSDMDSRHRHRHQQPVTRNPFQSRLWLRLRLRLRLREA